MPQNDIEISEDEIDENQGDNVDDIVERDENNNEGDSDHVANHHDERLQDRRRRLFADNHINCLDQALNEDNYDRFIIPNDFMQCTAVLEKRTRDTEEKTMTFQNCLPV